MGLVTENRGSKVAEDRSTQEILGHAEDSAVGAYFFPWNGMLELPLFEVAQDEIVVGVSYDVVSRDLGERNQ